MAEEQQQTYQRAATAALLGLGTQLAFAIVVAGLGLYARSNALHAAAWHLFGGLPIWVALWMLYQQHRLERREALEAEQLAREDARTAALFDEAGHNLAAARKRLEGFYRWGLNAVSITVAVYLLSAGLALLWGNWRLVETGDDGRDFRNLVDAAMANPLTNPWMLVGFTALLSFLGFLVARYIAGMTRVPAWQLLRGGAAYLIGNVLVLVLTLVAVVAGVVMQSAGPLAALALFVPALMAVLGLETLLAFVLGIYRPRRKGEIVRPAFDSRLLGWLTRPESLGKIVSETLNYQFGFEITKSWFYVLLGRALTPLIAAGVVILLALTSVVIVAPNQQAVVTHNGAFVRVAEPGVSFKLPWPLGRAEKVDVKRSQQLVIGTYEMAQRVPGRGTLWTNDHVQGEVSFFATAPTQIDNAAVQERIEQDLREAEAFGDATEAAGRRVSSLGGLVSMQAIVTYNIDDLARYVGAADPKAAADRPERVLAAVAQRRLNALVASRQIDDLLGIGRVSAGDTLLAQLRAEMAPYGLFVQDVLLYDIHPPKEEEVAAAFLRQVNALQAQKTAVENAQRDAIGTLSSAAGSRAEALVIEAAIAELNDLRSQRGRPDAPDDLGQRILDKQTQINRLIDRAGGEASRTLADARQDRWRTALAEKAQSSRFVFELAAFERAPDYFRARTYLEAIADAFADANRRVISTVPMESDSSIRLNLEDAANASDIFTSP
ncbi:MAG: SPFH domain-containing protein [Planctomycetota bacterium]